MLWYSSALNCNRRPVPLIRYAEAGIRLVAAADAAAAKLLQSCPTLGDPTDGSPLGSPISGILQAKTIGHMPSVQFSSVAQLCPTLCNPMNCCTPGLPVHHQLPESTQTHVHCVGDAIQPSHPLLSPSPPLPIPPKIKVFSNESTLPMRWPTSWSFSCSIIPSKEIPGLISFRMDWLDLLAV